MDTIDNQEILKRGRTPSMAGGTLALFLTFDGTWYRVRTRVETLGRYKRSDRAEKVYSAAVVTP